MAKGEKLFDLAEVGKNSGLRRFSDGNDCEFEGMVSHILG